MSRYSKYVNCLDIEHMEGRIIEIGLTVLDMNLRKPIKTVSFPISYVSKLLLDHFKWMLSHSPVNSWEEHYYENRIIAAFQSNYVSPEIEELTGWTQKKLTRQGEPLNKVLDRLYTKYGTKNRLCVVDCANEFDLFGEDNPFGKSVINISDLYRIYTNRYEGTGLKPMCDTLGVEFKGPQHRANWDSLAIGECFLKLVKYA